MATYKSAPRTIERSQEELFNRFSDLSHLQSALDSLSPEQRQAVGEVEFTADTIKIVTPQVGAIEFCVQKREHPSRIVFRTASSPVPLTMTMDIKALSPASSQVETLIDVEIPAMLRPMVGPHLQKAADKFGELIAGLSR
ncbi:MAG: hypothetical protein HDS68_07505 [Bacteroidales bacterium]|nr:hypothetical protein [Bacteroidales bacterium]